MFAKLLSSDFQDSAHVRLGRVRAGRPLLIRTGLVWCKHRVQHQVGWCNGHSPANLHENIARERRGKSGDLVLRTEIHRVETLKTTVPHREREALLS